MRRLFAALATIALFVAIIGVSLMPLLTPPFTATLSQRYSLAEEAGLPRERMLEVAEQVRAFVVERRGTLPATVDGRAGFDPSAVSHLDDVGRVMTAAMIATPLALAVFAACVLAVGRGRRGRALGNAFVVAGAAVLVNEAVAAAVGMTSFDALFAWFHSLFFAAGTWTFPYDSLLIQLFPEEFWIAGGIAWAGGMAVTSALLIAVGVWLRRRFGPVRAGDAARNGA